VIPESIVSYLDDNGVRYRRLSHATAVTASELAERLHASGHRVAKSVLVEADGIPWLAVLPAARQVDMTELTAALSAHHVRVLGEDEFARLFPECEVGAEPPFGRLFGVPVVADSSLHDRGPLVFHAGSHEEALEMDAASFWRLEAPLTGAFARRTEETGAGVGTPHAW
jgi:Ala-tRNA(Pro) deacylase